MSKISNTQSIKSIMLAFPATTLCPKSMTPVTSSVSALLARSSPRPM
jgi:hypothetical protein